MRLLQKTPDAWACVMWSAAARNNEALLCDLLPSVGHLLDKVRTAALVVKRRPGGS